MSLLDHLLHTCTIQRATKVDDRYKNSVKTWSDWATGVRCRLVYKGQRVVNVDERVQATVVTSYLLLLPAGTDVIPDDRITVVTEANGTSVDAGPFRVAAVLPRNARAAHHVSLALERIS